MRRTWACRARMSRNRVRATLPASFANACRRATVTIPALGSSAKGTDQNPVIHLYRSCAVALSAQTALLRDRPGNASPPQWREVVKHGGRSPAKGFRSRIIVMLAGLLPLMDQRTLSRVNGASSVSPHFTLPSGSEGTIFPGVRASCPLEQPRAFGPLRAGCPHSRETPSERTFTAKAGIGRIGAAWQCETCTFEVPMHGSRYTDAHVGRIGAAWQCETCTFEVPNAWIRIHRCPGRLESGQRAMILVSGPGVPAKPESSRRIAVIGLPDRPDACEIESRNRTLER